MNQESSQFSELKEIIEFSQKSFADLIKKHISVNPISIDQYARFLSIEYHLTKDAYWYFTITTSHKDVSRKRSLRNFLTQFAREEELHYLVAAKDLQSMGKDIVPEPMDVALWHAYFKSNVIERPFIRLGAACVLENIAGGAARDVVKQLLAAPFLTRENTRFVVIHQHEIIPHGDQILEAMANAKLSEQEIADLCIGARMATVLYLRITDWSLSSDCLAAFADNQGNLPRASNSNEVSEINDFKMESLEHVMPQ